MKGTRKGFSLTGILMGALYVCGIFANRSHALPNGVSVSNMKNTKMPFPLCQTEYSLTGDMHLIGPGNYENTCLMANGKFYNICTGDILDDKKAELDQGLIKLLTPLPKPQLLQDGAVGEVKITQEELDNNRGKNCSNRIVLKRPFVLELHDLSDYPAITMTEKGDVINFQTGKILKTLTPEIDFTVEPKSVAKSKKPQQQNKPPHTPDIRTNAAPPRRLEL